MVLYFILLALCCGLAWADLARRHVALKARFQAIHGENAGRMPLEQIELAAILDSMTEGLILYDMAFTPLLINPALHHMAQGLDRTSSLDPRSLFAGRLADPARFAGIEEAMKAMPTRPRDDTIELVRPDQWLKRYSTPLYNPERKQVGHLVIFRDITPEVEADQMRQDFVANASHELRTPVTSMKVLIESLMEGAQNDPELRRSFLHDVFREVNRLHALVNDLLDLAQLESNQTALRLQDLDAVRVVREAVATVIPQARQRDIRLDLAMPASPVPLRADRVRLRQILVNLLANSVKFTPAGGCVTLQIDPRDEGLCFRIQDTGIGIPQSDLPHIFDRFFRVTRGRSRLQGGSGLGLSLVKQAIEAHQGQISVDSVEGEGTTFSFTIPQAGSPVQTGKLDR